MATSIVTLRLVKCPKCSEILTEFSNIPIYQCGGCGTTLRAKNYNATNQGMIGGTMENELENLPHCVSLHSRSLDEKQNAEFIDPRLTFLDDSNNCFEDMPELEHDEDCNEEREDDPDCKGESEVNCSANEVDKSSKVNQQSHDTSKLSERMQDLAESSSSLGTVASDKSCAVGGDQDEHGNLSPPSSTASGNPYDGSVSSDDDQCVPNVSATFEERRVDQHEGKQDESQEVVLNANDMIAENKAHRRRHTTLNSDDFHSVQTWLEPEEDDEPLKFPSKSAPFLNSHGGYQMEILRMVDELREEISEMFDKSDEGRGRCHFRAIQQGSVTKKHDSRFFRLPSKAQSEHGRTYTKLQHSNCYRSRTNTWNAKLCHKPQIEAVKASCDKSQSRQMKRHCRPVLGGAPFVICLNCSELLQVPIDFLVATKRLHKLRCGACSKVLVFSSRARDCGTRAVDHSPSELGSGSDAFLRHEISNSRLLDRSQSQSISYSTEIELPKYMEKSNGESVGDGQFQMFMDYDRPQEPCPKLTSRDGTNCSTVDMAGDDSQSFLGHVQGSESPRRRRTTGRRTTSPIHQLLRSLKLKTCKNGRKHSGH